jgi:hypothetical protein
MPKRVCSKKDKERKRSFIRGEQMGYRISIVFDLKKDNRLVKEGLRHTVQSKFEKFKKGVKEMEGLEIRLEEADY